MSSTPDIRVKRVYEDPEPEDGHRVLVDRLWPRGLTKEAAAIDEWNKDAAPSHDLRRWIHADLSGWAEFRKRYARELDGVMAAWAPLIERARAGRVTLLYAAKNTEQNHANELLAYLLAHASDGRS